MPGVDEGTNIASLRGMPVNLTTWETAEVRRSRLEALHTPAQQLVADEKNVARYLDPSLDTAYPLEYAFAVLGDVRRSVVLDFGCGSGGNTLLLSRRAAHVIAIDISPDLIRLARRRLAMNGATAQFVLGSAHYLPLDAESVDVVFGNAILHHLDLDAAAREVHRVLKSGGRAIFKEPVRDSPLVRRVRGWVPYRTPDVSPHERPLSAAEIAQFAMRFRSSSARAFCLPFVSVTHVVPPLQRYMAGAYRLDAAVLKRFPRLTPFAGVRVLHLWK